MIDHLLFNKEKYIKLPDKILLPKDTGISTDIGTGDWSSADYYLIENTKANVIGLVNDMYIIDGLYGVKVTNDLHGDPYASHTTSTLYAMPYFISKSKVE